MILPRSKPAKFPPNGAWPLLLTADMAAAALGYENTQQLAKGVVSGDAPPPTGLRNTGKKREPVWAYEVCQRFVAERHGIVDDSISRAMDVKALI